MNRSSIAVIASLAAYAVAQETCDPAYQCTLYDAENFDASNGVYSFCMDRDEDTGEFETSSAFYMTGEDNEYGTFKPEEFASFKCGSKVQMSLCSGYPRYNSNPNYYYEYSCYDGEEIVRKYWNG